MQSAALLTDKSHVSLLTARSAWMHWLVMLLSSIGSLLLVAAYERKSGGLFYDLFPRDFAEGEVSGYSYLLISGVLVLLVAIVVLFGLRGFLHIRKNEAGEFSAKLTLPFERALKIEKLGRVEFCRKFGFRLRNRITLFAIFYDANDNPVFIAREHSNWIHVIKRHYPEKEGALPKVPQGFVSVITLQQVWAEHKLP